jgi:alpha-tubulin suppressor-like RCC1 family protein
MNFFGELGNYTLRDLWRIPVSPTYLPGEVHSVAAGGWHTCVLAGGSPQAGWGVACFGENSDGQLGDGGGEWSWVLPRAAKGLDTGIEAISTGARHTCALGTAGSLRCWGDNDFGQLGDKTRDDRRTPVAVRGLSEGVVAVSAGDEQTCALVVGGRVKCWGTHYGNEPSVVDLDETTIALALGATQACALTSSAGVKCWGADTGYVPTAVDLGGDSAAAVAVGDAHACALTGVGGVKCWGSNSDGQLGDGTTVDRTAAVTVVGLASGVKAVAAGATRSCALRTGGEMVCWGAEPSHCSGWRSPVPQTISLSAGHVRTMSLGRCHTCVTLAQAETETASSPANIQCWGRNDEGELGVNNGYLPVDVITVEVRGYLPYTAKQ